MHIASLLPPVETENAECLPLLGKLGIRWDRATCLLNPCFRPCPKGIVSNIDLQINPVKGMMLILPCMWGRGLKGIRLPQITGSVSLESPLIFHSYLLAEAHSQETVSALHLFNTFRPGRDFKGKKRWPLFPYKKKKGLLWQNAVCMLV